MASVVPLPELEDELELLELELLELDGRPLELLELELELELLELELLELELLDDEVGIPEHALRVPATNTASNACFNSAEFLFLYIH